MKRIGEKITAWKGPSDQKQTLTNRPTHLTFTTRLLTHSGIPEASDAIAYEPVQRLIAVSTTDGRIKIFGRYGIECSLKSNQQEKTRILTFLPNSGSLIRVSQSGVVELFDMDLKKLTSTIEVPDDGITCLSTIPGQPHIMLGCLSGLLRVCCMADGNLDPIQGARPISSLRLLNYRVSKYVLGSSGRMISLSTCLSEGGPLALMLHSASGLLIWNIRFSRPVCALPNLSLDVIVSENIDDPGEITCAAWIGKPTGPYLFATGHESGDVFTWLLPKVLHGVNDRKQMEIPRIVHCFTARPPNALGSRIHSISFISGSNERLLVFGGQPLEEPEGLNVFELEPLPEEEATDIFPLTSKPASLAWFGNIVDFEFAPPPGSMEHYDDPVGILVLTESGNWVMHDLQSRQPIPFSMPFQISQKHCSASLFIRLLTSSLLFNFFKSNPLLTEHEMDEIGGVLDKEYSWILDGGCFRETNSKSSTVAFLVLGYEDGSIRFWNLRHGVPTCLYSIHKSDLFCTTAVKTIEVLDEGSFLTTGDEQGHVFVFQLSDTSRSVKIRKFSMTKQASAIEETSQNAGYQLLVVLNLNAAIRKIAFHTDSDFLAALDDSGSICIINLVTLDPIFVTVSATKAQHKVIDMEFCVTPVMVREHEFISEVVLFLSDEASNLAALDPSTGELVKESDWLHPRHSSKLVRMLTIDDHGIVPSIADTPLMGSESFFWTAAEPLDSEELLSQPSVPESREKSVEAEEPSEMNGILKSGGIEKELSMESIPLDEDKISPRNESEKDINPDSDDEQTGAMLAAAVAKIEDSDPKPQTKSRKGRAPWKRKQEGSPKLSVKTIGSPDRNPELSSPVASNGPYLLVITEVYIRIYLPQSAAACIRAPLHKVTFSGQIAWAVPVIYTPPESQEHEGGLLVLSCEGSIDLFALPSLENVGSAKLDEIVGFPLLASPQSGEGKLSNLKLFEGDGEGGIFVCSQNGELLHFDCIERERIAPQRGLLSNYFDLYDWELAHAAHSASHLTQADAPNANASIFGEKPTTSFTFRRGVDFIMTLGRRARDELDKAVRPGIPADESHKVAPDGTYNPPTLDVLFCVDDHKPPPEIRSMHQRHASLQEPILVSSRNRQKVDISDVIAPVSPKTRTVEEVREKYGRPRKTYREIDATEALGGIMADNMAKLSERGNRLQNLNEKAEDMANEAQSFAALSKQLAEKNKKWWQF